jgi:hypothetical protein
MGYKTCYLSKIGARYKKPFQSFCFFSYASDGTPAAYSASGDFAKALALSNAAFTSSASSSDYSASSACELSMSLDNILLIRLLANISWCTLAILEIISITISALLPFTLLNSKL